jgi:hypothetical protein
MKNNFTGLTFITILFVVFGLSALWATTMNPSVTSNMFLLGYSVPYSLLMIVTGIGLFLRKKLAYFAAVAIVSIKILQQLVGGARDIIFMMRTAPDANIGWAVFGIVTTLMFISIFVGILYYLTRIHLREQFR